MEKQANKSETASQSIVLIEAPESTETESTGSLPHKTASAAEKVATWKCDECLLSIQSQPCATHGEEMTNTFARNKVAVVVQPFISSRKPGYQEYLFKLNLPSTMWREENGKKIALDQSETSLRYATWIHQQITQAMNDRVWPICYQSWPEVEEDAEILIPIDEVKTYEPEEPQPSTSKAEPNIKVPDPTYKAEDNRPTIGNQSPMYEPLSPDCPPSPDSPVESSSSEPRFRYMDTNVREDAVVHLTAASGRYFREKWVTALRDQQLKCLWPTGRLGALQRYPFTEGPHRFTPFTRKVSFLRDEAEEDTLKKETLLESGLLSDEYDWTLWVKCHKQMYEREERRFNPGTIWKECQHCHHSHHDQDACPFFEIMEHCLDRKNYREWCVTCKILWCHGLMVLCKGPDCKDCSDIRDTHLLDLYCHVHHCALCQESEVEMGVAPACLELKRKIQMMCTRMYSNQGVPGNPMFSRKRAFIFGSTDPTQIKHLKLQ